MRAAGMAMGGARAESELFCYFLVITLPVCTRSWSVVLHVDRRERNHLDSQP